jgi:hypothetical protein
MDVTRILLRFLMVSKIQGVLLRDQVLDRTGNGCMNTPNYLRDFRQARSSLILPSVIRVLKNTLSGNLVITHNQSKESGDLICNYYSTQVECE